MGRRGRTRGDGTARGTRAGTVADAAKAAGEVFEWDRGRVARAERRGRSERVRKKTHSLRPFPDSDLDATTEDLRIRARAANLHLGARDENFERTREPLLGRADALPSAGRSRRVGRATRGDTPRVEREEARRARASSRVSRANAFAHRARVAEGRLANRLLARRHPPTRTDRAGGHRARVDSLRCSSPWRLRTLARPRRRGVRRARSHPRHLPPRRPRPRAPPRRMRTPRPRPRPSPISSSCAAWTA